ncbi:hypothetical protein OH77DRAFT_612465 [Trametes cingulata]|nr:hypothetical protein OH77DRAFT_612465 [Trametes cingulata]
MRACANSVGKLLLLSLSLSRMHQQYGEESISATTMYTRAGDLDPRDSEAVPVRPRLLASQGPHSSPEHPRSRSTVYDTSAVAIGAVDSEEGWAAAPRQPPTDSSRAPVVDIAIFSELEPTRVGASWGPSGSDQADRDH